MFAYVGTQGTIYFKRDVTVGETCIHYFTMEFKRSSSDWITSKEHKTQLSADMIIFKSKLLDYPVH